ncbi:hypothetical protein PAEPH01_2541 [Pancytospora epiphaga]|nr:hypothetical protein PAEPH01_2541 [Pancytospora epiphaga]
MTAYDDSIRATEEVLKKHTATKKNLYSLSTIISNLKSKISVTDSLKDEISEINTQLYFYDMVDCLSGSSVDNIALKSAGAYLNELIKAAKCFNDDFDAIYVKKAEDLQERLVSHGLKILEVSYFIQERYDDEELKSFLLQVPIERVEHVYFKCRRKVISSKISECVKDIRKNYKLFIVGEVSAYLQVFGEIEGKHFSTKDTFPVNINDLKNFEKYLYTIFTEVFKRINYETVSSIVNEASNDTIWPNQIFCAIAEIFYGHLNNTELQTEEQYAL